MEFMLEEVPGKEVSITEKGDAVLTYSYGETEAYAYFHPLYTPNGQVITEGTLVRHLPGLCFSIGSVSNENGKHIRPQRSNPSLEWEICNSDTAKACVKFVCNTRWKDSDLEFVETCETEVHPIENGIRILDIAIMLQTQALPIAFEENTGLGFYASEMEHRKTANADGRIGEMEVNQQPSEWATLSGITANTAVGLALLPHPSNGQTIFIAEDAYQGYLQAQTPKFTLDANSTCTLRYRVVVYVGDLFTIDLSDYCDKYIAHE